MHPLEGLAGMAKFATSNSVYNLKFIPADKLAWKPAPTAKSAFEIVGHITGVLNCMKPVLEGQPWAPPEIRMPSSLEEAQSMLTTAGEAYAAALTQVPPADLGKTVTVWGNYTIPLGQAASMPVADLMHHHGQIAYLQTLLGDEEMHFVGAGT